MTVWLATVEDADEIAAVHVQSWQAAYRGLLPDDFLNNLSLERRTTQWQSILSDSANMIPVYEDHGQVVGFVSYGRSRDEYEKMFNLKDVDLKKRILGVGDGPASFNARCNR